MRAPVVQNMYSRAGDNTFFNITCLKNLSTTASHPHIYIYIYIYIYICPRDTPPASQPGGIRLSRKSSGGAHNELWSSPLSGSAHPFLLDECCVKRKGSRGRDHPEDWSKLPRGCGQLLRGPIEMLPYSPRIHGVLWLAEKIEFRNQGPRKEAL